MLCVLKSSGHSAPKRLKLSVELRLIISALVMTGHFDFNETGLAMPGCPVPSPAKILWVLGNYSAKKVSSVENEGEGDGFASDVKGDDEEEGELFLMRESKGHSNRCSIPLDYYS